MKARPILFSGPMVRALLDGRKTQTRRIVKPQPPAAAKDAGVIASGSDSNGIWWWLDSTDLMEAGPVGDEFRCPYGVPGDLLWVRETHAQFAVGEGRDRPVPQCAAYRSTCAADGTFDYVNGRGEVMNLKITKWTSAIHMPRWASRLTLRLHDVRVQRLREISEADSRAEGARCLDIVSGRETMDERIGSYASHYRHIWEEINGQGSWNANPWVWALTFAVLHENVDDVLGRVRQVRLALEAAA